MVVILVDCRTLPRLARSPAVATKIIPPSTATFSATTTTPAALANSWLKIPARLAAATAAPTTLASSFAGPSAMAAAPLALSLATPCTVATLPTTLVLTRCGLGRSRRGCGWG